MMSANDLADLRAELPSLYELEAHEHLPEVRLEARRRAREGAEEGTVVWARHQDRAHRQDGLPWRCWSGGLYAALVLRPELPRERWPELIAVLSVSLGAAIAEHSQPLTPLGYRWPDLLCLGPDPVGSLTLDQGPDWVVLGFAVNVTAPDEPGRYPCLALDAGSDVGAGALLGRSMRFFLDWVNRWAEDGFAPVRRAWLARRLLVLSDGDGAGMPAEDMGPDGALQWRRGGRTITRSLADALDGGATPGGPGAHEDSRRGDDGGASE